MIRDPSDGSVKENGIVGKSHNSAETVIEPTTSGLPLESTKASNMERLERSRDWLRKYRTDPESVVRRMGDASQIDEGT